MPTTNSRPNFLLFQIDESSKGGQPKIVPTVSFQELGVLELQHIEQWVSKVPGLLGDSLLIITTQFSDFDKTKERSDILALDDRGKLVVIELKRDDSGDRQDLQALRYAAYCSTLTIDHLVEMHIDYENRKGNLLTKNEARDRFVRHITDGNLESIDEDTRPRIVLVAGGFRDELICTCLWLIENFKLDITCVQLVPHRMDGQIVLASSIRIPLPEAQDYMIRRNTKHQTAQDKKTIDWNRVYEVIGSIPPGWWMSYADVAEAAGATRSTGMALGQHLARAESVPCEVHRVIREDRTISEGWSGDIGGPDECRKLLEKEGLHFDERGRADLKKKFVPPAR